MSTLSFLNPSEEAVPTDGSSVAILVLVSPVSGLAGYAPPPLLPFFKGELIYLICSLMCPPLSTDTWASDI